MALALGTGVAGLLMGAAEATTEDSQTGTSPGIDPYYTGSLLSPSPAVAKAGEYAFEPYVVETINPAKYGVGGGLAPLADTTSQAGTLTLIKYGLTDHLTIGVFPQTQTNQDEKASAPAARSAIWRPSSSPPVRRPGQMLAAPGSPRYLPQDATGVLPRSRGAAEIIPFEPEPG